MGMRSVLRFCAAGILALACGMAGAAGREEPPHLAQRGAQAYAAGQFELARFYFERAYRLSLVRGHAEHAARSALNLADMELEQRDFASAGAWLDKVPAVQGELRGELTAWLLWKRSQWAYGIRRPDRSVALVDSALEVKAVGNEVRLLMQMDRLRFRAAAGDTLDAGRDLEALTRAGGEPLAAETAALTAWMERKAGRFDASVQAWRRAAGAYRKQGRWASAGECLVQESLSLLAAGNPRAAAAPAQKAVGVFQELGLPAATARSEALLLLVRDGENALAKSNRDSDLPPHGNPETDWGALLDALAQDITVGPGGGAHAPTGPFR